MNKSIRKDVPVAWMLKTLDGRKLMLYGEEQPPKFEQEVQSIPLYTHERPHNTVLVPCDKLAEMQAELALLKTHPAELTDEEITAILKEIFKDYKNFYQYQIDFANAILREAHSK